MKRTRARSLPVLLMTLAFFAGMIYFLVNLTLHSAEWASMPQNEHISDASGLEYAGKILDKNGIILARSVDGKRVYHEDEEIRKSCLHIVGDDSINIATAVQTRYRSELSGYNIIFGLGWPDELKSGRDITLTIDSNVQKAAYQALGKNKGAVILYNYKTGEILCMVSTPAYDPANKPEDINTNDQYEGAYINRVLSAAYPPGSTFKLVTSAAGINYLNNIDSREYNCTGKDEIGGKSITCYEPNGQVDLKNALATSCNCYFAHLAVDLGKVQMTTQAEKMGFNKTLIIDGIECAKSIYDVKDANTNHFAWSGVGQHTVMETPINMVMRTAAIANGGVPVMPYFVKSISGQFGMQPDEKTVSNGERMLSVETAQKLAEMMDYTAEVTYGKDSFGESLDVCAKTGTAEISERGDDAHAWVTGFAKDEDCPLAFAVIVENGNSGFGVAIPVAKQVLEAAARSLRLTDS